MAPPVLPPAAMTSTLSILPPSIDPSIGLRSMDNNNNNNPIDGFINKHLLLHPNDPPYDTYADAADEMFVAFSANKEIQEERECMKQGRKVAQNGRTFIPWLYSYRSISKAIPLVQGNETHEIKAEMNKKTFQILRPQIVEVKKFHQYAMQAVKVCANMVEKCAKTEEKKHANSDEIMDAAIELFDQMVILDQMKDTKPSLHNDFSRYKRALASVRQEVQNSEEFDKENLAIYDFLNPPRQNFILNALKAELLRFDGFGESGLALLLNHCVDRIEEQQYITVGQLHAMHRAIPHIMMLLDRDGTPGFNLFKQYSRLKPAVRWDRIIKIIKQTPIVPLYMDMHIDANFVLKKCPNFTDEIAATFVTKVATKLAERYELVYKRQRFRQDYNEYSCTFSSLINQLHSDLSSNKVLSDSQLSELFDTVLRGVLLLTTWSAAIVEQCAWKFANPSKITKSYVTGENLLDYEKAVLGNYTQKELGCLVDVIFLLKSLAVLILQHENFLTPLLHQHMHKELQIFLQIEAARPLRKAHKNNRPAKTTILQMRAIGGDYVTPSDREDYLLVKTQLLALKRTLPSKSAAPTPLQLSLVRRLMFEVFNPRASGMQGGLFAEKDLKPEWLSEWKRMYNRFYFFMHMLNFTNTVRRIVDLSFLWYREFYLDLSKELQFRIELSLPWILCETVIKQPTLKEHLLYVMDVYNDAADTALRDFKQQHLYDEVEAELNLSFDQLLFHLSEDIFLHAKTRASAMLIDQRFETSFHNKQNQILKAANPSHVADLKIPRSLLVRYNSLLCQRSVALLGRIIDFNYLISQTMNAKLLENIKQIIRRFETQSISSIVEIEMLLNNARQTHALLSVSLQIDPFDDLLHAANDDMAAGVFWGRIVQHALEEMIDDFLPSFAFTETTQRFVRAKITFAPEPKRPRSNEFGKASIWYGQRFNKPLEKLAYLSKFFFGYEHIQSLFNVLGKSNTQVIVHELFKVIEEKLVSDFGSFSAVLLEAVPLVKLPKLQFGVVASFLAFQIKFENAIGKYPPLRSQVFQSLRVLGNILLFCRQLDTVYDFKLNHDLMLEHPLLSIEDVTDRQDDVANEPSRNCSSLKRSLNALIERLSSSKTAGDDDDSLTSLKNAADAAHEIEQQHAITKTLLGQSFFAGALGLIQEIIDTYLREMWDIPVGTDDMPFDVNHTKSISRLLSVFQFLFCLSALPEDSETKSDFSIYGDGIHWGICALVHLMGHRRRFELLDYSYHVLRLYDISPVSRVVVDHKHKRDLTDFERQQNMVVDFVHHAKYVKDKNDEIFAALELIFPVSQTVAL